MTVDDDFEMPLPKPRRRIWRKVARVLLIGIGLLFLIVVVVRWQLGRSGQRQLDAIAGRLDATEPGWRLQDLEKARSATAPPPESNPAPIVLRLRASFSPELEEHLKGMEWDWGPVTHKPPSFFEFIELIRRREVSADVRRSAREQLLRPEVAASSAGHYTFQLEDNPFMILLPHIQKARELLNLLDYEARLAVVEGDPRRGLDAARAALVVGRSIGEEPILISQLTRLASDRIAARAAMQVLAWSDPKTDLATLQREFRTEADMPWLLYGLRGERGGFNQFFDNLRDGKISLNELEILGVGKITALHEAAFRLYKAMLPGDQAKSLEILSAYMEAAKLPPHQQLAAIKAVPLPPRPPEDFRYIGTSLLIPALPRVAEASIRTRGELLTASVALACERFRQMRGRWPATLDEVPRDILPEIPPDPYTGNPIQYRVLDDGVAVFTSSPEADNHGPNAGLRADFIANASGAKNQAATLGCGWRLWNPELRRKAKKE